LPTATGAESANVEVWNKSASNPELAATPLQNPLTLSAVSVVSLPKLSGRGTTLRVNGSDWRPPAWARIRGVDGTESVDANTWPNVSVVTTSGSSVSHRMGTLSGACLMLYACACSVPSAVESPMRIVSPATTDGAGAVSTASEMTSWGLESGGLQPTPTAMHIAIAMANHLIRTAQPVW
jgi:hypothetical protein